MSLLISAFEGFSDQDFETYASARWSNNRYNLPRMKVKERLTALARAALPTLEGWSLDASSEIPDVWNGRSVQDQWVYLIRDASARARLEPLLNQKQSLMAQVQDPAQHHQHLILGLRLDVEGLAFGLWLHAHAAVDRAHVLARAAAEPEGLAAALAPLEMAPSALLARLRVAAMEPWLFVGERLPRDEVEALGGDIEARVAAQLEALSGLWRFAAWDEAHDHGAALAQLSALEAARAARAVTLAQQQEVAEAERAQRQEEAIARAQVRQDDEALWRERRRKHRAERRAAEKAAAEAAEQAKAEAQAKAAARAAERAASALVEAAEITAPTESMSSDAAPDAPSADKPKADKPKADKPKADKPKADKPKADKPKADKPSAGLKLGARVCLERGLLAGKEGEISALNGAYIKVRVGPLEVNVKAEDLRLL